MTMMMVLSKRRHPHRASVLLPLHALFRGGWRRSLWFVVLAVCATSSSAAVLTLNDETWLDTVGDDGAKSIFVFLDEPHNPDCRALDDVWAQLAADWHDHPVGLVARVNCADPQSAAVCDEYAMGMKLPLLIYGDPRSPEYYDMDSDADNLSYTALAAFAQTHIRTPTCSIYHMEYCNDDVRTILQTLMKHSQATLEALEQAAEQRMAKAEQALDAQIAAVQAQYKQLIAAFNDEMDVIRDETNYKWLQQVLHDREMKQFHESSGSTSGSATEL